MTTIQEVLFAKQDTLSLYLEKQMGVEHTGSLPWDLLDYITYDVTNPIIEVVKCAGCRKHFEDYTHTRHNDYTNYGELYCPPCYEKYQWV